MKYICTDRCLAPIRSICGMVSFSPTSIGNCQPYRNNPKTTIRSDENTEKKIKMRNIVLTIRRTCDNIKTSKEETPTRQKEFFLRRRAKEFGTIESLEFGGRSNGELHHLSELFTGGMVRWVSNQKIII